MKLLKKFNLKIQDLYLFLLTTFGYFATRLYQLTRAPIFTDESIYLRWAQIGTYDAAWRFIPLTDGKPPLYHWFVMLTIRLFNDPLFAGRIVSVVAGFVSLIGIWLLAETLFQKRYLSWLAAAIYITSPMMFIYDRLAIVDSMLTTFSIWSFLFVVWMVQTRRLDTALLFGASVGAGLLTKTSGLIFFLLSPATILLAEDKIKKIFKHTFSLSGLFVIAFIISQLIYSILRLSQFFYRIGQKNHEFILTIDQFLAEPFSLTKGNLKALISWQLTYLTIPLVLLIILAFVSRRHLKQKIVLSLYYIAPLFMIASFNKIIFPRFLIFSTPWLFMLALIGFDLARSKLKKPLHVYILYTITLIIPLYTTFMVHTNPAKAAIPKADKNQYFIGQPTGAGVDEIVDYLNELSQTEPIFLGTDGTFGLTPNAFEVYFYGNNNIEINSYYPVGAVPEEVIEKSQQKRAFFIYYNVQDIPEQSNIELVREFTKIGTDNTTYLRLYEVFPQE